MAKSSEVRKSPKDSRRSVIRNDDEEERFDVSDDIQLKRKSLRAESLSMLELV